MLSHEFRSVCMYSYMQVDMHMGMRMHMCMCVHVAEDRFRVQDFI